MDNRAQGTWSFVNLESADFQIQCCSSIMLSIPNCWGFCNWVCWVPLWTHPDVINGSIEFLNKNYWKKMWKPSSLKVKINFVLFWEQANFLLQKKHQRNHNLVTDWHWMQVLMSFPLLFFDRDCNLSKNKNIQFC